MLGKDGKPDARALIAIVFLAALGTFTYLGYAFTFLKKPPGLAEKIIALPTLGAYLVSGDPHGAAAITFVVYLFIFGGIGFFMWHVMVRYVFEVLEVKEYMRRKTRRQNLLAKLPPQKW
jgi:hypothetical protein